MELNSDEDWDDESIMLIPESDNPDDDFIITKQVRDLVESTPNTIDNQIERCLQDTFCRCNDVVDLITNFMSESNVIQSLYLIIMHFMNVHIRINCLILNSLVQDLINASIWYPILFRDAISAPFVDRLYSLLVEGGVDSVSTGLIKNSLLCLLFRLNKSWNLYLSSKDDFLQMMLVVIRNRRSEWEKAIYLLLFLSNNNPQNAAKIVRLDPNLWQIGLMRYQDPTDGMKVPLFAKVVMKIYLMAIEIYRIDRDEVLLDNLSSLTNEHVRQLIGCQDLFDTLNLKGLGMDLIKAKNSM